MLFLTTLWQNKINVILFSFDLFILIKANTQIFQLKYRCMMDQLQTISVPRGKQDSRELPYEKRVYLHSILNHKCETIISMIIVIVLVKIQR